MQPSFFLPLLLREAEVVGRVSGRATLPLTAKHSSSLMSHSLHARVSLWGQDFGSDLAPDAYLVAKLLNFNFLPFAGRMIELSGE